MTQVARGVGRADPAAAMEVATGWRSRRRFMGTGGAAGPADGMGLAVGGGQPSPSSRSALPRAVLRAPFVGYGAYYYGGGGYREGCGWLRRRAEATGSPYWWRRYEDCVDDNY